MTTLTKAKSRTIGPFIETRRCVVRIRQNFVSPIRKLFLNEETPFLPFQRKKELPDWRTKFCFFFAVFVRRNVAFLWTGLISNCVIRLAIFFHPFCKWLFLHLRCLINIFNISVIKIVFYLQHIFKINT